MKINGGGGEGSACLHEACVISSLLCIVYYGPEIFYNCLRLFITFACACLAFA